MKILLGLIILLLVIAVNVLLMPYLLFIVLGALGFDISFLICIGIWLLLSAIGAMFK